MKFNIDGMDMESVKFYDCYLDGTLVASGVIKTNEITEFSIEIDDEEHEVRVELAKAADKKENDSMSHILLSIAAFLSKDIRLNYFTIYHCVHEGIRINGDELSDEEVNMKIEVPDENKPYYSIEGDELEKTSNLNPEYMKRTYSRYKSLLTAISIVLILLGAVLLFTSNREPYLFRTMAMGSYALICGVLGYIKRSRIAKKQYEEY